MMENLVYLELRRRGFDVYVGNNRGAEIDFVAMDGETKLYIQVCYSFRDPSTEERGVRPLRSIDDDYRKIVVTMEPSLNTDRDGIAEIGLRDLLTGRAL